MTQPEELACIQNLPPWYLADLATVEQVCARVPVAAWAAQPRLARWRAQTALIQERDDALHCLELAHDAHMARADAPSALLDARIAIALCFIDVGGMDRMELWLQKASLTAAPLPTDPHDLFWMNLGAVACAALSPHAHDASHAAQCLHEQLRPLCADLSANEKLVAAQVLVNYHYTEQRFEHFDWLSMVVEHPSVFDAATPLARARWLDTLGHARFQIADAAGAERCWRQAMAIAQQHALPHLFAMTQLALMRLLIDAKRLDEAQAIEQSIQPAWGAGRTQQLIDLQQMRARLHFFSGRLSTALSTLQEALQLADRTQLSMAEQASCRTDWVQMLVASGRSNEARDLLGSMIPAYAGRDAEVLQAMHAMLGALQLQDEDVNASHALLSEGLRRAEQTRHMMFFRLLPDVAAAVCALALRWNVEPVFVKETIRSRRLASPSGADATWPWPLWLKMLGGFEMVVDGSPLPPKTGKVQHKPLELLRWLGCQRTLSASVNATCDALWPDADGISARKNLEMTAQRLRRLLEDDSLLRVGDGRISLDSTRISSDVVQRRALIDRLEALAMQAPASDRSAPCAEAVSLLRRVATTTDGGLLPGAPDAPWLEAERQRCERDLRQVVRAATGIASRAPVSDAQAALLLQALGSLNGE